MKEALAVAPVLALVDCKGLMPTSRLFDYWDFTVEIDNRRLDQLAHGAIFRRRLRRFTQAGTATFVQSHSRLSSQRLKGSISRGLRPLAGPPRASSRRPESTETQTYVARYLHRLGRHFSEPQRKLIGF